MAWEYVTGGRLSNEFRRRAISYLNDNLGESPIKPHLTGLRNNSLVNLLRTEHPDGPTCPKTRRESYRYFINLLSPANHESKLSFYESDEWREVRYRALLANGGQCQCCGRKPPKVILHVDHIKPRSKYPELELEISNLQILCEDCNLGKSNKDDTDWRESAAACAETGSATAV